MKWPTGMDRKPLDAKGFYIVLIIATCLGLAINFPWVQHFTQLSAIRALFWSAVINGVIAAPIMVVMMLMSRNKNIMGPLVQGSKGSQIMGWLATSVMALAALAMVATWRA
jgi:Mn2+/Fe2+ NRAMP family transporter